ncbi:MAG: TonB family protein [Pyrinomonadaceae bacterium]
MQCQNCGHDLPPGVRFCTKCGALVAQPSPVVRPQPQGSFGNAPRGSFGGSSMGQPQRKSGCGKILLILALVGVVGLAGIGVAIYYGYRSLEAKLKTSEAYTIAIAALKSDPEVADKLGTIKETGFPLGDFHENADGSGAAAYKMSVVGTKSTADYTVVMMRRQRKWQLVTGKVTLPGGAVINIKSSDDVLGDNPEVNDNTDVPPPPPPVLGKGPQGTVVSGGVLNGKALSKPEPAYPPIAKAARASGTVVVQITVDETGKVIAANPVSGHPLLQQPAVAAARQARFTPMLLAGRPVKVTGILTYNFAAQ